MEKQGMNQRDVGLGGSDVPMKEEEQSDVHHLAVVLIAVLVTAGG